VMGTNWVTSRSAPLSATVSVSAGLSKAPSVIVARGSADVPLLLPHQAQPSLQPNASKNLQVQNYRPIPSTFCLSDKVKANSLYEANRLFDISFPERQRVETFEI